MKIENPQEPRIWIVADPSSPRWWFSKIAPPMNSSNHKYRGFPSHRSANFVTSVRKFMPGAGRIFFIFERYVEIPMIVIRAWYNHFRCRKIVILLHDNLKPLERFVPLLPRKTGVINFWWNDSSEAVAAILQYSDLVRRLPIVHIAGNGFGNTIRNTEHRIQIWPNFCLVPVDLDSLEPRRLEPLILYMGELRVKLPENEQNSTPAKIYDDLLWGVSEELALNGIKNWPRLKDEFELELRHQTYTGIRTYGGKVDLKVDFIVGNRLRFLFIQKLLESELHGTVRLAGKTWASMFPKASEENFLGTVPNYPTTSLHRNSRVILDLGSRSLDSPIECYERSMQIITNGPGYFRLNDFPDSRLLAGVEDERSFNNVRDMVSNLVLNFGSTNEQYFAASRRIAANYELLRVESWIGLSALASEMTSSTYLP